MINKIKEFLQKNNVPFTESDGVISITEIPPEEKLNEPEWKSFWESTKEACDHSGLFDAKTREMVWYIKPVAV